MFPPCSLRDAAVRFQLGCRRVGKGGHVSLADTPALTLLAAAHGRFQRAIRDRHLGEKI